MYRYLRMLVLVLFLAICLHLVDGVLFPGNLSLALDLVQLIALAMLLKKVSGEDTTP